MAAHKHTQTTLARLVGASQQQVSDWLNGRRISLTSAIAVRDVAGVPVEAWLEPVSMRRLARSA